MNGLEAAIFSFFKRGIWLTCKGTLHYYYFYYFFPFKHLKLTLWSVCGLAWKCSLMRLVTLHVSKASPRFLLWPINGLWPSK